MPKLSDEELLSIVDAEFASAMGGGGGEISKERATAWDYYLSKEMGNEIEGQSQIRTSDVSDVVDGIMPSLLRMFTTADNLLNFDPVGPEDTEAARQASDYVNHMFFKRNKAFIILYTWFFDALVQKNGIVKAWWDESEVVTTESYQGLTDTELALLLDDEELEPEERDERQEVVTQPVATPLGVMPQQVEVTVHDIKFKRKTKRGQVRVEGVPPEEYRISSDARSVDPCDARMVGHERDVTRSELLEMGFDKALVDSLPAESSDTLDSDEEIARRDKTDETGGSNAVRDPSQDTIKLREAYIRVDVDGDGRSELRQVFTAGNEILGKDEIDRQPFHVISPQILPHKHFGRSVADKVMDIQEVNTTILRQVLDNVYHTTRPGHAVWEQGMGEDTLDDLLTTDIGRVVRFGRPVGESYQPMTVPFTAGATFPIFEFFDKAKRDRTGISSDSEGLSPESLKNIQTSVLAQAFDASRGKIEAIARIFAETGIKSLFLHMHELLLKHQDKEEIVQLRGHFVEVDPRQWKTRSDMTVNIGLGIGTREQNLLHLNAISERQEKIVQNGGMGLLVKPKHIYNTNAEIVKNANLKQPEMFFENPGDKEAPPPSDEQTKLAQMQAKIQERQQQLDAQDLQLKARKQQLDAQEMVAKANQERQEMMLKHQRELSKIAAQREANEDKMIVEMEKIRNQLTQMELTSGQNVPGSAV